MGQGMDSALQLIRAIKDVGYRGANFRTAIETEEAYPRGVAGYAERS
jgi:hypothetical protein